MQSYSNKTGKRSQKHQIETLPRVQTAHETGLPPTELDENSQAPIAYWLARMSSVVAKEVYPALGLRAIHYSRVLNNQCTRSGARLRISKY